MTIETAVAGVDAVVHQAAMVGLGVDFDDVADYVHHNDSARRSLLRALHRARFRGRLVLASSMVVYGEGRYRCDIARRGRARRRGAGGTRCRTLRTSVPGLWFATGRARGPGRLRVLTRGTSTPRRSCTKNTFVAALRVSTRVSTVTALRYHNVYGPRMPRDTPYAGVASIFRSALARGDARRCSKTAANSATSSTCATSHARIWPR